MRKDSMAVQALVRAAATTAYVALVATFMSNADRFFGRKGDNVFIPIFMLLLFLISATITSYLVLGKPVMLYHDGDKKGAVTFLFATVGWLAAFLVVAGIILATR